MESSKQIRIAKPNQLAIIHNDSFELIRKSRNEILKRTSSCAKSEKNILPNVIPRSIHLIAVNSKRRKAFRNPRTKSSVKYIHKSILSVHELMQAEYIPEKRNAKSQESIVAEEKEEMKSGRIEKRGRSFEFGGAMKMQKKDLEKVFEEVRRRKCKEQKVDKMFDQIILGNTTFEDIFNIQHRIARHQQIISTIPPGVNFPTPKSGNTPSLMAGSFNIPMDDEGISLLKPTLTWRRGGGRTGSVTLSV